MHKIIIKFTLFRERKYVIKKNNNDDQKVLFFDKKSIYDSSFFCFDSASHLNFHFISLFSHSTQKQKNDFLAFIFWAKSKTPRRKEKEEDKRSITQYHESEAKQTMKREITEFLLTLMMHSVGRQKKKQREKGKG